MELVMVERRFVDPVEFGEIQAKEDAGAWCLETNEVQFQKTYFSKDRRRMLCLYRAPDAEAVRRAQRQAQMPFEAAWSASRFGIPALSDAVPTASAAEAVLVERAFDAPMSPEHILKLAADGAWCLQTYRATYVEGYLSLDGLRMVCHFLAPDAESVRVANDRMKLPWRAAWAATIHRP